MATGTSNKCAAGVQARALHAGVNSVSAIFTIDAAHVPNGTGLSAGDIIQMVKIPSGATILDLKFSGGGGGGAYTCAVGDGNSVARYISATTFASTGQLYTIYQNVPQIVVATANGAYQYSADDTIDIQVTTVLTATLAGVFTLNVTYAMDT